MKIHCNLGELCTLKDLPDFMLFVFFTNTNSLFLKLNGEIYELTGKGFVAASKVKRLVKSLTVFPVLPLFVESAAVKKREFVINTGNAAITKELAIALGEEEVYWDKNQVFPSLPKEPLTPLKESKSNFKEPMQEWDRHFLVGEIRA